ncbi:MAG: ribosome maturation factor RimM [Acidimicrobiia bacterium]
MLVGRIGRPHGLHGYVTVHPETDNPDRFAPGSPVLTDSGDTLTVQKSQERGNKLLVRFEEVGDRTAAEALTGTQLFIDEAERRPLADNEYWPDDLVGLAAVSNAGVALGRVESVIEGAAQFRLVIRGSEGQFEVPFVAELVPEVDLASGTIVIADLPGLVPWD